MGFENAWELVSTKSPLLGISHFFFPTQGIWFLQRGKKPRKQNKKNWGGLLLCDVRASITLLYSCNKLEWIFSSTKGGVILRGIRTTESLPHRRALPEKLKLQSWLSPKGTLSLV